MISASIDSLFVILEADINPENSRKLCQAIKQFSGVLNVVENVTDSRQILATERARADLESRLWAALREKPQI